MSCYKRIGRAEDSFISIRMQFIAAIYLIAFRTMFSQSAGELVIAPRNTESKVGDTTYFNCSTNLQSEEIFWYHGEKYIYTGSVILEPYQGRFTIDRTASVGSHNLVINSVEPIDAGEYSCADDDRHGTRRSAELVVLEYFPGCQSNMQPDGVIGQNIFSIPPDELQLTCNVTYYGNIPPQMEWRKIGDNSSIKDSLSATVTSPTRLIYSLKLTVDIAIDNTSYVCQTTMSTRNQYKCKSETIKVLYFLSVNMIERMVFRGDEITCTTQRNTFHCTSQWHYGNKTFDETITANFLGEYLCTVICHVRGRDYYFEVQKAFVVEAATSAPPSISGTIAASVVVPIVIVVIIVVLIIGRRIKQKYKHKDGKVDWMSIFDGRAIPEGVTRMPYKGSSGEVFGPFLFRGSKCACERIMFPPTRVSSATEDDICGPGKRWMELSHQNVLRFFDVRFQIPALYVVMDYAEGGSVRNALNSCTDDLDINLIKDWATQIAHGMNYLHSRDIIHRCLKSAQVLIMEPFVPSDSSKKTLKIASYNLTTDGQSVPVSFKGMFAWMAPETIQDSQNTCKTSDVWSYGVTVWEILTRKIPHKDVEQAALFRGLAGGNLTLCVPTGCSEAIRGVLNGCWERNVNCRPTFSQIMSTLHTDDEVVIREYDVYGSQCC